MKALIVAVLSIFSLGTHAGPLLWTFGAGDNLAGSFTFNADSGTYSAASFSDFNFFDTYTSISAGNDSSFTSISSVFFDETSVTFLNPLTNSGGVISYNGMTECFSVCGDGANPFTYAGTVFANSAVVVPVAVSEPEVLTLWALGLLGLGLSRRRKLS